MIYLDNAATTFPKPKCMLEELNKCITQYCGNPGRSGHIMSVKAAEKIYECRETLASFLGSSSPENVVFTLNTTHALNTAIKSLYQEESHVLISNMEHNSVLRPIFELKKSNKIDFSVFNVFQSTENILFELERKRRTDTKMLIMTHASNICGAVFPIKEIGAFCKKHNICFIVDAAQSAGIEKIEIDKFGISALCAPAHKGLYGPQGLGFVIFGNKMPRRTIIQGGNGTNSLSPEMGVELPESFEAGTPPTPLIAALNASVNWVKNIGTERIREKECALAEKLRDHLYSIKDIRLYGPAPLKNGIVLFSHRKFESNIISRFLDSKNICARGGFHCAPLAHQTLSTPKDGAIRFSVGYFNTEKEIHETYKEIKTL